MKAAKNYQKKSEIKVLVPKDWDDIHLIADDAKIEMVVFNLEKIEGELRQCAIDFLSGGAYALGDALYQVSEQVYMLMPADYNLKEEWKTEERNLASVAC